MKEKQEKREKPLAFFGESAYNHKKACPGSGRRAIDKGGDKMSIEAIEKVTQTEQNSQKQREEALAAGRQAVEDARKEGARLVEEARRRGEAAARQMMTEAEEKAAKIAEEVLRQGQEECRQLRRTAQERLPRAAERIVEGVVKG